MSTRVGESTYSKHGPFDLEYTDWGSIVVSYKGIPIAEGRPWIKDPRDDMYSELVLKILEEKESAPKCCKPACGKERSELSNYCPDHQMG